MDNTMLAALSSLMTPENIWFFVIGFLFVLTLIVFVHEFGHFIVARWCGITVKVFSIGFGRELVGWTDRKGTRWRISAIPLGGYVRFLGDENGASMPDREGLEALTPEERAGAFANASVGKRAAVVAAGPIANFILAIAIFTAVFAIYGRQVTAPLVDQVVAGSAAEEAGFQPHDLVRSIDGTPVATFNDFQRIVSLSPDQPLSIVVERGGTEVTLAATPRLEEIDDGFGGKQRVGRLGISRTTNQGDVVTEHYSLPQAFAAGTQETWSIVTRTFTFIGGLFRGTESASQLGGPISVAMVASQAAAFGFAALLTIAAVMSVSIGLLNLFPIPMLDGGHLLFYLFEALRGRPLSERAQEIGFRIGFAALILLMVFATYNDVGRIVNVIGARIGQALS